MKYHQCSSYTRGAATADRNTIIVSAERGNIFIVPVPMKRLLLFMQLAHGEYLSTPHLAEFAVRFYAADFGDRSPHGRIHLSAADGVHK